MAIQSLLEVTPLDQQYDLGEEVGKPQIPLVGDDEYGFQVDECCFSLVKRRYAGRTGTEKDGKYDKKVIKYIKWEPVDKFTTTYWSAMKSYIDYIVLQKLSKGQNLSVDDIKKIYIDVQKIICDTLKSCVDFGDIKEICSLLDVKQKLIEEAKDIKNDIIICKNLMKEINQYHADIKDKRKIIVEVDKPKNHKIKEENA